MSSGVTTHGSGDTMAPVAWCSRGALGRCWRDIWNLVNGNLQPFWVRVSMKVVLGSSKTVCPPTGPVPCQPGDERGLMCGWI